jgi:hypothetical protein
VRICNLLFKSLKSPKYELFHDGKKISETDEDYSFHETNRKMFVFSISNFKSEHKGVYECVVSTIGESTVSTAVKAFIDCKLMAYHACTHALVFLLVLQ